MFLPGVVATARQHWRTTLPLSIVTFTDTPPSSWLSDLRIPTPHLPWPRVTLLRYRHLWGARDLLGSFQYLYMTDADMEFVAPVGDEILGDLVATIHCGHAHKRPSDLPFLNCRKSRAHIEPGTGKRYYAGGFQGGRTARYLEACRAMDEAIRQDAKINYVADWHDESHWNAYLVRHQPTTVLPPEYCFGNLHHMIPDVKILALDKPHAAMRA
jgi:hypothetical protein